MKIRSMTLDATTDTNGRVVIAHGHGMPVIATATLAGDNVSPRLQMDADELTVTCWSTRCSHGGAHLMKNQNVTMKISFDTGIASRE